MSLLKTLKAMFTSAPRATPAEHSASLRAGTALLVDVREPREWTSGVAQSAALLPLSDLTGARQQWADFLAKNSGRELLVYCASGGRSAIAARILVSEGFRAANAGGFSEWAGAGWPVVKPSGKRN